MTAFHSNKVFLLLHYDMYVVCMMLYVCNVVWMTWKTGCIKLKCLSVLHLNKLVLQWYVIYKLYCITSIQQTINPLYNIFRLQLKYGVKEYSIGTVF